MMKAVEWFHMEEEFCIGLAVMGNKDVFIVEEAERFEAPSLTVCDSLEEAVSRKWCYGRRGIEDLCEEDHEAYLKDVANITVECREVKDQILIRRFLRQMDELFTRYGEDDCLDGYRLGKDNSIYIKADGEHCDSKYMWPALDAALHLYNRTYGSAIWMEEYAEENGEIRYEFGIDHYDE